MSNQEEVNAWGSYETTGNNARRLTVKRRGSRSHRRPIDRNAFFNDQSAGANSAATYSSDPQQAARHKRSPLLPTASERQRWNRYFDSMSLHMDAGEAEKEVILDEEEMIIAHTQEEQASPKSARPLELSSSLKLDMRQLFGVYFDSSASKADDHHHASTSLDVSRHYSQDDEYPIFSSHVATKPLKQLAEAINGTMPWLPKHLSKQEHKHMHKQAWNTQKVFWMLCLFVEFNLRGIAQVFFQNNPVSGVLILTGLLVQSTRVAIHGLIALAVGNLTALIFGMNDALIQSGLFGYNAVLVGLATATFDGGDASKHEGYHAGTILYTIVFAAFSSIIFVAMGKVLVPYKSPPLTFPFNVAQFLLLLSITFGAGRVHDEYQPVRMPSLPDSEDTITGTLTLAQFLKGTVRGVGQVFLANELSAGLLILAGLAVCSRISAVAAFCGSAMGTATAVLMGVSSDSMINGLWGFNASLSCTAMLMFFAPEAPQAVALAVLASVLTALVQSSLNAVLQPYGLPCLTLPFCVVSLTFIILQGTTAKIIAIPLASMTTPEDHRRRVQSLRYGFALLLEAIHPVHVKTQIPEGSDSKKKESSGSDDDHHEFLQRSDSGLNANLHKLSRVISVRHSSALLDDDENHHHTATTTSPQDRRLSRDDRAVLNMAQGLFEAMDNTAPKHAGHLYLPQLIAALKVCGLDDEEGIQFVSAVFHLLDLDHSASLEPDEFGTFCLVSHALKEIRHFGSRFVDFVDADGNGDVDFDEIDEALAYLGEPCLTEADKEKLSLAVIGHHQYDDDDGQVPSLDSVELINFVTVAAVKHLVKAYHDACNNRSTAVVATATRVHGRRSSDQDDNPDSSDTTRDVEA